MTSLRARCVRVGSQAIGRMPAQTQRIEAVPASTRPAKPTRQAFVRRLDVKTPGVKLQSRKPSAHHGYAGTRSGLRVPPCLDGFYSPTRVGLAAVAMTIINRLHRRSVGARGLPPRRTDLGAICQFCLSFLLVSSRSTITSCRPVPRWRHDSGDSAWAIRRAVPVLGCQALTRQDRQGTT